MASGNLIELSVKDFPIPNGCYWVLPRGKHVSNTAMAFREHVTKGLSLQKA
jgi:hypothetical protein